MLQHRVVPNPDLPEEKTVHQSSRVDQLAERLSLVLGKRGDVGADLHRSEARDLGLQRAAGDCGFLDLVHWRSSGRGKCRGEYSCGKGGHLLHGPS